MPISHLSQSLLIPLFCPGVFCFSCVLEIGHSLIIRHLPSILSVYCLHQPFSHSSLCRIFSSFASFFFNPQFPHTPFVQRSSRSAHCAANRFHSSQFCISIARAAAQRWSILEAPLHSAPLEMRAGSIFKRPRS